MPFLSLVTLTFALWPSNSSERGTKHIFHVNLAQIRSAVPEIFLTQTKNTDWRRQKQNLPQFTACGKNWWQHCRRFCVLLFWRNERRWLTMTIVISILRHAHPSVGRKSLTVEQCDSRLHDTWSVIKAQSRRPQQRQYDVMLHDQTLLPQQPLRFFFTLAIAVAISESNITKLDCSFFMVALCNRACHYIFILFLSSFFFFFFFFLA